MAKIGSLHLPISLPWHGESELGKLSTILVSCGVLLLRNSNSSAVEDIQSLGMRDKFGVDCFD